MHLLTVREAARRVGRTERTIRRWLARGLRHYRQGRAVLISEADLLAAYRGVLHDTPKGNRR